MKFLLFPSFFDTPPKIRFAKQEENEVVELFLRQHPIVNVPWIFISFIGLLLPPVLIQLDAVFGLNIVPNIPTQTLLGGITVFYLIILAYAIESFLHWYYNIYIVTNIHVVDINFTSLLSRSITEVSLKDIESISASVSGILGSLFNYGDVKIETAATTQAAIFEKVPKPDTVADRIQDLRRLMVGGGP